MTEPTQHAESVLEECYRPRLVEEMRMNARSPFNTEADKAFWNRMAELFATKPWAEVVAVYLGAAEQFDGGGAGSQDPSDEAQQRPLRGSMPSPATDHSDGSQRAD